MAEMIKSMEIGDKYRILLEEQHLPKEISKEELDNLLTNFKEGVQQVCSLLHNINDRNDIASEIISLIMEDAQLDYKGGKEWHLEQLIFAIEQYQKQLCASNDDVPSYEDSKTIFDAGYTEEWYDSGIYVKILEDTEEREVVEEVNLKYNEPIFRRRTTIWETIHGGRRSKEIRYESLPVDDHIVRLICNTKRLKLQE